MARFHAVRRNILGDEKSNYAILESRLSCTEEGEMVEHIKVVQEVAGGLQFLAGNYFKDQMVEYSTTSLDFKAPCVRLTIDKRVYEINALSAEERDIFDSALQGMIEFQK